MNPNKQASFIDYTAPGGACILRASHLPCPHGFSTRIGGVSCLPACATLNLGRGLGCDDGTVWENLRRFGEAASFDPTTLIALRQVHGSAVREVHVQDAGLGYARETKEEDTGDGYVTADWGVTLGVRTADCLPVLACAVEPQGRVCAVGAFHAGWRGSAGLIVAHGVEALCRLGAKPAWIRVAIGPGIHACCFEVGEDVLETFARSIGRQAAMRYIRPCAPGKFHADLYGINQRILLEYGVPAENILLSEECTACLPQKYFSHRASNGRRGSMLSVIRMP